MSGTGGGDVSQFHRIDINTGVATELGADIGFGGDVGGLVIDPDDVIYAGTGGRGPNTLGRGVSPTLFFTIDPATSMGNQIGPLGIEFGPGTGSLSDGDFDQFGSLRQNIAGWSYHPDKGELYGMTGRGSQLFTVDPETGVATRIGSPCESILGYSGGNCGRRGNAIAFDDDDTLYWANDVEIAILNPETGLIDGPSVELDFTPFGEPSVPSSQFRVVAMDFHPLTGDLYAAVLQGEPGDSPAAKSTLAILDPDSGTFDIVGEVDSTGVKLDGIAFTSPDYTPPPECFIKLNKRMYTNDDSVIADVFRLANLGNQRVKTEIKIWLHKPDKSPKSLFNLGGFGGIRLPAGMEVDFGPIKLIRQITEHTPRGSYEFSCRMLDPVTGELLFENRNFFEVRDPPPPPPPPPPPGGLTFEQVDWTIEPDADGPGVYGIFMIARVSPLTVPEVQEVGGRLIWDGEAEVVLCSDTNFGGGIEIRGFGDGYVDVGDGFESNSQATGCPINADLENAFGDFGPPTLACVSVVVGGIVHEYCAPLNEI